MSRAWTRSTWVLCGLIVVAVVSTRWCRINLSPSVPYGLYRLVAVREPLAHGTLVVLPVPASVQAWWSPWVPLLKPVAVIAGEAVCIADGTLWVKGVSYGPVLTHHHGQPLPHLDDCMVVPPGGVFVASQTPRSLDSRYFGVVPVATLIAQAVPIVTW